MPEHAALDTHKTSRGAPWLRLLLLTAVAVAIHGYHLGVEDGEIYIPAAKKLLHPSLYPFGDEFFLSHAHLSLFSPILAWTARFTHLSMDATVFLWYLASMFLMLAACWVLAAACFQTLRARWCSVLVTAAVVTMPATNTGLLLMDPYLTARSFSTPLTLLVLGAFLQKRYVATLLLTLLTACIHPQMVVYLIFLTGVIWLADKLPRLAQSTPPVRAAVLVLPPGFHFGPAQQPYREALYERDFYFLANWTWYDWLGMLAPLAILYWFWKARLRNVTAAFRQLSFALIPFGMLSILVASLYASSHNFDMYARTQPLRCFHLITLIFVLLLGGVIGEYLAGGWRWVIPVLVISLSCGMFCVQREAYPFSPHIENPWAQHSSNAWVDTLLWIRGNTPENAVFAVDSLYFKDRGVDLHGFRTISERSALADYYKDGGVVAIFPNLAVEWKQMSDSTRGLDHAQAGYFHDLARRYPVTWTVIHGPAPAGLECPYQQRGYSVCKI